MNLDVKNMIMAIEIDKPIDKPILGVAPFSIWIEKRIDEISMAIDRYKDKNLYVPEELERESILLTNFFIFINNIRKM